jgi:hypothetical protein
MANSAHITAAATLLNDFAARTGISSEGSTGSRRYLWTDAFAVQAFFGISALTENDNYRKMAFRLIDLVHEHLGKYHPEDSRKGWINGMSPENAILHPTVGGLRIGKRLPERQKDESYNSSLEWERDGQYFHYLSRWIMALLQAGLESGEKKYDHWALELLQATDKFIYKSGSAYAMYWKMDTELSHPQVASMGAHDPLEGLLCTKSVQERLPEKASELDELAGKFESMCAGRNWSTPDALGIGGLLLNTVRAEKLSEDGIVLPHGCKAGDLWNASLQSLRSFMRTYSPSESAVNRLAFRECGMSLGIFAALNSEKNWSKELEKYRPLGVEIEKFWQQETNQEASTWREHLDINEVSLACSLIAHEDPSAFTGNLN